MTSSPAYRPRSAIRGSNGRRLPSVAAAAAEAPAAAAPFTGYRHIVEQVREEMPGSKPRAFRREVWVTPNGVASSASTAGDGTRAETMPLALRAGPFGQAPLAELPTDPDALLRALNAAYDDGSYAAPGEAPTQQPKRDADVRRAEMSVATASLIAESNATPELRAALVAGSRSPGAAPCATAIAGRRPCG